MRNYFIQRKYALIFPSRSNITTLVLVSQGLVSSPSTFAFSLAQWYHLDRDKRIWYLSPMRAAKVQASLRIRAVSPEPPLLAHKSSESRGTFRQKARSLAPLNGWACAVKICHDGMLEDTNSLGGAHFVALLWWIFRLWWGFVARLVSNLHLSRIMTKPTKWHVRPAKTQISLGIRPVWSESSLSAWRNHGSLATQKVHSEDSDRTGRMPRLIWVFLVCTATLLVLSWGSSFMLISILLNVC